MQKSRPTHEMLPRLTASAVEGRLGSFMSVQPPRCVHFSMTGWEIPAADVCVPDAMHTVASGQDTALSSVAAGRVCADAVREELTSPVSASATTRTAELTDRRDTTSPPLRARTRMQDRAFTIAQTHGARLQFTL
jgi:hypothetical protein